MSTQVSDWQVPAATLRWLDAVPAERGVAMLVRHSVRDPLPPGDLGYANTLNAEGVALARSLGERLHGRLRSLHTIKSLNHLQLNLFFQFIRLGFEALFLNF